TGGNAKSRGIDLPDGSEGGTDQGRTSGRRCGRWALGWTRVARVSRGTRHDAPHARNGLHLLSGNYGRTGDGHTTSGCSNRCQDFCYECDPYEPRPGPGFGTCESLGLRTEFIRRGVSTWAVHRNPAWASFRPHLHPPDQWCFLERGAGGDGWN